MVKKFISFSRAAAQVLARLNSLLSCRCFGLFPEANSQGGVLLCELTNPDGAMANLEEAIAFSHLRGFPVLAIEDLIAWLVQEQTQGQVA